MLNNINGNYVIYSKQPLVNKKENRSTDYKNQDTANDSRYNVKYQGAYLSTPSLNKVLIKSTQSFGSAEKTNTDNNISDVKKIDSKKEVNDNKIEPNNLRTMFQNNEAKIMGIVIRTFNANDENNDELINGKEKHGTFLNAIDRLDEVKSLGINTLHILPFHEPGKLNAMGTAGSVYSPLDLLSIDPVLDDKDDPRTVKEECKEFVNECHKRGIRVMLDLPSCASYELFLNSPELMAIDRKGVAKTPQGWNDIRMFEPFADETKRTLNPDLLQLHKDFVDMCIDLGIDGVRADVARAKPTEFWDIIIPYSHEKDPEFAWLAETYTYEDASPQLNMMYDRPEDSLNAGFDSYYGQYHIFHEWTSASELVDYVKDNLEMSHKFEPGKSLIGSFGTHDDMSLMFRGGAKFTNLVTGLQATLPMTNPYIIDGYQTGDYYQYPYKNAISATSMTDSNVCVVHEGKLDIFNLSRKPGGDNPEIEDFFKESMKFRDNNKDIITKGSFIPLNVKGTKNDQIITFARHLNGKTFLVVANRNVNNREKGIIEVPGLKKDQSLNNLLPSCFDESYFQTENNQVKVDLGAARIHVFEIDTPDIEKSGLKVYKQNIKND